MKDKTLLMIPGPTPVPESVLFAMAKHPIGHRSGGFSNILKEVNSDLKWLFQTKNDVFIFAASGTGAMDAALSNILNEGDKVLALIIGNFGERWAKIAESRGAVVEKIVSEYGDIIEPAVLEDYLKKDINKEIKVVTLTHCETSTSAKNDIKTLCKIIKNHGVISVVDGVSSVAAMEIKMDDWGIDVLVSGSQKGFMMPPGLSFLCASEKAFEMHKKCKYPSFYFNWSAYKKSCAENSTPFTASVNLVFALHAALKMMRAEGLEGIYNRHKHNARLLRNALKNMGLKLLVEDENKASYTVTAVFPPVGVTSADIRNVLKNDYDIVIANGQGDLKDKIFRIGTLGFISERDVLSVISALETALQKLN